MLRRLKRRITKDQCRDTGMAVVLVLLLLAAISKRQPFVFAAVALQVVNMTVPQMLRPAAIVWLGLADALGIGMSKVLLFITFFSVVTPIAVVRRLIGKDSLHLRAYRAGVESAMLDRNHTYVGSDLERPY